MTIPFFTLGNSPPSDYLHPLKPLRNLWGFLSIFSLFTFIIWQTAVMLVGWFYCQAQSWLVTLIQHVVLMANLKLFY